MNSGARTSTIPQRSSSVNISAQNMKTDEVPFSRFVNYRFPNEIKTTTKIL